MNMDSRSVSHQTDTDFWIPFLCFTSCLIFLSYVPIRIQHLQRLSNWRRGTKSDKIRALIACPLPPLVAICLFEGLHTAGINTRLISSSALGGSLGAALAICYLSWLESRKRAKPSDATTLYLCFSILCDTLWVLTPDSPILAASRRLVICFVLQLCLKIAFLVYPSRDEEAGPEQPTLQQSPEEHIGIIKRVLFWWINPILAAGSKKPLELSDLPLIPGFLRSQFLRAALQRAWTQRGKPEGNLTLLLVLLRSLARQFAAAIPPRIFLIIFRYGQPVLIRQTIQFLNQSTPMVEERLVGFWILVMAFFIYVGLAISTSVYQHRINTLRSMTRGALVNLIYARLLKVQSDAYEPGKAVTLMSVDAENLSQVPEMLHDIWAYVLEVLIGTVMLAGQVGWLWLVPIIFIFCCSRVSRFVAKNLQSRQKDWTVATQQRIGATSSMLGLMKSIKASGLSSAISRNIEGLRLHEISMAKRIRWIMVIYNASANALGIFTPVLTMILYSATSRSSLTETIDAETMFTTIAILTMVTHPANMIMTIVPRIIANLASFERVQTYLLEASWVDQRDLSLANGETRASSDLGIRITNATILSAETSRPILEDVNIEMKKCWVTICSGAVGSGKSVLAKVILGEIPLDSGTIEVVSKRIGYCSQSIWLPEGTIQQVICAFERTVDTQRYEEAIRSCCLDYDIGLLPDRDQTLIGSRGLNLSGGQRQRLALARLVYANCEVQILDDSFSSLDPKTKNKVIHNLFGSSGIFRKTKATVFWICNDASFFHLSDSVIFLKDSKISAQGIPDEMKKESQFGSLLVSANEGVADNSSITPHIATANTQQQKIGDAAADLWRRTGDFSLYRSYFMDSGLKNSILMMMCTASYSIFITFPHYWVKMWVEAEQSHSVYYMVGYGLLSFMAWISTSGTVWATYILMASTSGGVLHQNLLETVLGAPMSFFSKVDYGSTVNRFSQDIALIDSELPSAASALANQFFKLIVQITFLLKVQKLILFTIPPCLVAIYIIQRKYLRTSRQLRLIDLESKAAVFSSFLETAEGLAAIRSFGWQDRFEDQAALRIDLSQQALYTLLCLQRWLHVVVDLTSAGIALCTITLAVGLRGSTSAGGIGVALNIVIVANTTLLRLVESWTTLETSFGAVARLKAMQRETPPEGTPDECFVPPPSWPTRGIIQIRDLSASYGSGVALNQITATISTGQRLLVCGRTGSGKSTLTLALLHMLEYKGSIEIDDINVLKIPRSILRRHGFITIPQDPVLMPFASLRFNIDPTQSLPDGLNRKILKRVHLWDHLSRCADLVDPTLTLDETISMLPVLSSGQSQLLALARAIARKESIRKQLAAVSRPVLMLDEATSSLDPVTEAIMLDVIDEEFVAENYTVIMVTHRPGMLMKRLRPNKDAVVFMKDGSIEKCGAAEDMMETLELIQS